LYIIWVVVVVVAAGRVVIIDRDVRYAVGWVKP